MKSIDLESAYGIPTILLGAMTNMNYQDAKFSTTSDIVYDVYSVDHVGQVSQTPGSVTYTYSGGSS